MPLLKMGCKGLNVMCLQLILNFLVASNLVVDGDFGNKTNNAVRLYQEQNNLVIDGIVGNKTWCSIEGKLSG